MLIARRQSKAGELSPVFRSPTVTVEEHLATAQFVADLIDQTLLKPEATAEDIIRLCQEADEYGFCSVCINPHWVRLARTILGDSNVRVCTVIGFPLGANRTAVKIAEARLALAEGAAEIDMVQNIGALRSADFEAVQREIEELVEIAHATGALLKVILETCLLTNEQKRNVCRLALDAKADFVKTSTGFSISGATEDDVRLMRETVGSALGVKASGGIRSLESLRRMVAAGATRIGTSSGVQILREFHEGSSAVSPNKSEGY
jgi:deoxyribose-phosphate aldolase